MKLELKILLHLDVETRIADQKKNNNNNFIELFEVALNLSTLYNEKVDVFSFDVIVFYNLDEWRVS